MSTYIWIAAVSGLILHLLLSTARIYRRLIFELLPQAAEEHRHTMQFDLIGSLIERRLWRLALVLPIAFLCTFVLLPYDLLKGWHWIEVRILRLLERRTS
ncbi:hypothetical protein [Effusibacillus pohliae]|uniref:hypothetical protein n=1 Tax=Effusibacillus pohliae TaxID=232270 RepID=UPI00035EE601|nr:hypothetical protein [Effusibacillus pohliae]